MRDKNSWMSSFSGKILPAFLLTAVLIGCSPSLPGKPGQDPSITSYNPRVYIHPASADLSQASVAVLPFQIPADMESVRGREIAALFQQTMLEKQVFHKVKLTPDRYGTVEEAMEIARGEQVDLVLAGEVNQIISGSSLGGGRLNLSLRIIDLDSSDTVWYIEQTVDQDIAYPENSMIDRLKRIFSTSRMPEKKVVPTVPVMLTRISQDICRIIKAGHYPVSPSLSR
ncbi:MAG: hypothetical protein ACLFV2_08905 [Desulfurivibrionaceae bacterium]